MSQEEGPVPWPKLTDQKSPSFSGDTLKPGLLTLQITQNIINLGREKELSDWKVQIRH